MRKISVELTNLLSTSYLVDYRRLLMFELPVTEYMCFACLQGADAGAVSASNKYLCIWHWSVTGVECRRSTGSRSVRLLITTASMCSANLTRVELYMAITYNFGINNASGEELHSEWNTLTARWLLRWIFNDGPLFLVSCTGTLSLIFYSFVRFAGIYMRFLSFVWKV